MPYTKDIVRENVQGKLSLSDLTWPYEEKLP